MQHDAHEADGLVGDESVRVDVVLGKKEHGDLVIACNYMWSLHRAFLLVQLSGCSRLSKFSHLE